MLLDTELIRRRRLELRYSERRLAAELGVSGGVIRGLESGANHADVTVGLVCRLAHVLQLEPGSLHPVESAPVCSPAVGVDAAGDTSILGAALHASETLVDKAVIVELLGWDHDRLNSAAERLDEQLHRCGLRLQRTGTQLGITRSVEALPRDLLIAAVRAHHLRAGISRVEAHLLKRIADGNPPRELSNSDAVALGVIVNADLTNGTTLTDDVAYSLLLSSTDGAGFSSLPSGSSA